MNAGDRVCSRATTRAPFNSVEGTLIVRAGFIVPGPAWWVRLDDDELNDENHRQLFDDNELELVEKRRSR